MHIGELAQIVGLHQTTLRRLERRGLIPAAPRDYNGRRVYSAEYAERVKSIIDRQYPPQATMQPGERAGT